MEDVTLRVLHRDLQMDPRASFRYIDISAIDQATKSITAASEVLERDAPSRARQVLQAGDVLVSTVRPNLNSVAHVGTEHGGCIASTGFCVLRSRPSELDDRFLFHWVRTPEFVDSMVRQASGASYPAVSDRIVKNSSIPMPPLEEQRRIAALLDAADALRESRRDSLARLDTLSKAIFVDSFGDPTLARYPTIAIGDLVRSGITRGIDQPGPDVADGVPYIKTTDFGYEAPRRSQLARAAKELSDAFPRSIVEAGDIVICIRATVGPSLLVDEDLAGANLSRGTARIAPSDEVLPAYLFAAVNSDHFMHQIAQRLRGATFLQIPLGELKQLVVPVPPLEEQAEFVAQRAAIRGIHASGSTQAKGLKTLFASLQQRAFRGEL